MWRILVVAHDAGGANVLFSLIKKYQDDFSWAACIAGPARKIFSKTGILKVRTVPSRFDSQHINAVLKSCRPDLVLTGTGWGSKFEVDFIKCAKKSALKTACFLDHWSNYRERFGYPGRWIMNLPATVFVSDKWAYKIALREGFPGNILCLVENPYFEEVVKQARAAEGRTSGHSHSSKLKVLYMSEPVAQHAVKKYGDRDYLGYTEYRVVRDLLAAVEYLKKEKRPAELRIRLHPGERTNKYFNMLNEKRYEGIQRCVSMSNPVRNSLVKDGTWADIVIGSNSMALVSSFIIGKRAISYVPNKKIPSVLFQKKIKKVHSIGALIRAIEYSTRRKDAEAGMAPNPFFHHNDLFLRAVKKVLHSN